MQIQDVTEYFAINLGATMKPLNNNRKVKIHCDVNLVPVIKIAYTGYLGIPIIPITHAAYNTVKPYGDSQRPALCVAGEYQQF